MSPLLLSLRSMIKLCENKLEEFQLLDFNDPSQQKYFSAFGLMCEVNWLEIKKSDKDHHR